MSQHEETSGPALPVLHEGPASGEEDSLGYLRTAGMWTSIISLAVVFVALMVEKGHPPMALVFCCLVTAMIGVALRFEAAIRERRRT
ncbi:hypothetical protein [Nonomuraea sp. NPDC002799]